MPNQIIQSFNIIGISVRTTNENGQSSQDIPALWNKFMTEGIFGKIPNIIENSIYCIYTDYEKDHTKPYTCIVGCKVSTLESIPNDMVGRTFEEAAYTQFIAKGNIHQGMVFEEWTKIQDMEMF